MSTLAAVALMHDDPDLVARVTACVALEGEPRIDYWVANNIWRVVAVDEWATAYTAAVDALNPQPGRDATVLPDEWIRARVQLIRSGTTP